MTWQQKVTYLKKQRFHDHSIIRFWHNHPKLASSERNTEIHWTKVSLRIVNRNLSKLYKLHTTHSNSTTGFPPHHQLWLCIHKVEGPWNDTSAPYYGGLQMHANWYGLGNAGEYSESVQEWTAERAYKAHGYSYSFLYQQWYEWDGATYCGS